MVFCVISTQAEEYKRHCSVLIQKTRTALQRLNSASETAKSARHTCMDLVKATETAYAQNASGCSDPLRPFPQVHEAALSPHRELNAVCGVVKHRLQNILQILS
jgi:hypothetical protein